LLIISLFLACTQEGGEKGGQLPYKQLIHDFKMIETREGRKSWILYGDSAYVYDKYILVHNLRLLFFSEKGETTATIVAPEGRLDNKTHDMVACGGVEAVTIDSSSLHTDSLFFKNESTLIRTGSPVWIRRPDGTEISGIGLVTTPDLTRIEIGGKIKGMTPLEPER